MSIMVLLIFKDCSLNVLQVGIPLRKHKYKIFMKKYKKYIKIIQ